MAPVQTETRCSTCFSCSATHAITRGFSVSTLVFPPGISSMNSGGQSSKVWLGWTIIPVLARTGRGSSATVKTLK